jgi:uncharacterized protein YneF (UPF0154 family)
MADNQEAPKISDHWIKIAVVVGLLVGYFILTGLLLGWHRVHTDWFPLDQSIDGPNLLVSFVWMPIAFVGGWIMAEYHSHRTLKKHKALLEEHHMKMADLLGIASPEVADALNSDPGDRQLDEVQ